MSEDFSSWRRTQENGEAKERFVSKARHIHRFHRPQRQNQAKREEERDRAVFLWVMAAVVAVGVVVAVALFMLNRQAAGE